MDWNRPKPVKTCGRPNSDSSWPQFWPACTTCTRNDPKWRSTCLGYWTSCANSQITLRATDRPTCWHYCASSAGTCADLICRSSPFGGRLCKGARCRILCFREPPCLRRSGPPPLMPLGRWRSAATGPTGLRGTGGGEVRALREKGKILHLGWQELYYC